MFVLNEQKTLFLNGLIWVLKLNWTVRIGNIIHDMWSVFYWIECVCVICLTPPIGFFVPLRIFANIIEHRNAIVDNVIDFTCNRNPPSLSPPSTDMKNMWFYNSCCGKEPLTKFRVPFSRVTILHVSFWINFIFEFSTPLLPSPPPPPQLFSLLLNYEPSR